MSYDLRLVAVNSTQMLYVEKHNGVSDWFRKNIKSNSRKDGSYLVTRKQVKSLLNDCERVLFNNSLSMSLVPPSDEFIVDGEVTEDYFYSIYNTVKGLKCILQPVIIRPNKFSVAFLGEPK